MRVLLLVIMGLLFACDLPLADPVDFTEQDLSGQDFSSLRIQGFDLSGKNLQNAIFRGSDVSGTNFTDADLKGASFEWARLFGTNFTNADMRGVNLNGACQFQYAIWSGSRLDPKWENIVALFDSGQIITQDLQGYDLSHVCFEDIKWDKPNFNNVNLESATLIYYAGNLASATFRNANLQSTNLSVADLTSADFTGAKFSQTILSGANLTGALISTDQLSNAILSECTRLSDGSLVNEEKCFSPRPTTSPVTSTMTLVDIGHPTVTSTNAPTITATPTLANHGWIVFTGGNDHNNTDIYTIQANGDRSTLTNLTNNSASDSGPSWSPDGTRIAFWSNREEGVFYLYKMNADGSDVQKLMSEIGVIHAPSWSPDGTRLSFSLIENDRARIFILDTQTLAITRLLDQATSFNGAAGEITPAWSPDGSRIAFASDQDGQSGFDIYIVNIDGSNLYRVTNELLSASDPDWTPDSKQLVYTCDIVALCMINTDGSSRVKLLDPSVDFNDGKNPSLSSDGRWLVFESLREFDDAIYRMSLDGLYTTRLTNSIDVLFANEPDWQPNSSFP